MQGDRAQNEFLSLKSLEAVSLNMANKVLIALNVFFNWGAFVCAMQRLDPSVSCAKTCCQTAILDRPMAMEKAEHDADVGDRGQFKVCFPVFQLVSSESAA